jgi:hypothetical protein
VDHRRYGKPSHPLEIVVVLPADIEGTIRHRKNPRTGLEAKLGDTPTACIEHIVENGRIRRPGPADFVAMMVATDR